MATVDMIGVRKGIIKLESDAKQIRRLSFIMNTILGNACYSDKEKDAQINKGEKLGNLNDKELQLLNKGWDLRKKLANKLMTDLTVLIDNVDGV